MDSKSAPKSHVARNSGTRACRLSFQARFLWLAPLGSGLFPQPLKSPPRYAGIEHRMAGFERQPLNLARMALGAGCCPTSPKSPSYSPTSVGLFLLVVGGVGPVGQEM